MDGSRILVVDDDTDAARSQAPVEMVGEHLWTIDELAQKAGTTVRKVRVYHDRGVLPPPHRKGRLGLYGPEDLHPLQLVLRMLRRRYPPGGHPRAGRSIWPTLM